MQLLVEKVEIQNKTEGMCRIRLFAPLPSENVGLTEQNTPRGGLEPPTFRLTAERSAIDMTRLLPASGAFRRAEYPAVTRY